MLKLVHWAPPRVQRVAAATLATNAPVAYERGRHFALLTREPGQQHSDLPIWVSSPEVIKYNTAAAGPVVRTDVPGVQGAFVLSNILSDDECDQINGVAR